MTTTKLQGVQGTGETGKPRTRTFSKGKPTRETIELKWRPKLSKSPWRPATSPLSIDENRLLDIDASFYADLTAWADAKTSDAKTGPSIRDLRRKYISPRHRLLIRMIRLRTQAPGLEWGVIYKHVHVSNSEGAALKDQLECLVGREVLRLPREMLDTKQALEHTVTESTRKTKKVKKITYSFDK
jgi:hypothetical protein